jgi:2,3-bisphosphoglycerate-independent phosphoglycerate mutase
MKSVKTDQSPIDVQDPMVRAVLQAYQSGQEDEALEPIVAVDAAGQPIGRLKGGDYVIFYDIRGEREIQLTESLIRDDFPHFPVQRDTVLNFVTMIEYSQHLGVRVGFPPTGRIRNTLTETVTRTGRRICKIAESEKAVHVSFFFNGKNEAAFPGEERIMVPSPEGIDSYAEHPEMSAPQVSDAILAKLNDTSCPLIVANLANVDVVGHIEDPKAVKRAVETVDAQLGRIVDACRTKQVTLLVTADHGTVEDWLYPDGQVNTGHTKSKVPFVLLDFAAEFPEKMRVRPDGELSDVAPTVLDLMGIPQPHEMTGQNLLLNGETSPGDRRQVLLLILDGWGVREEEYGNLIRAADTPHFDAVWEAFPKSCLQASGEAVGMPAHTVGNSESGHLHLGAGRRILLDRVRIDRAIEDGSFFRNPAFLWAMQNARNRGKALHLLGIVSHYSSHGTIRHLFALLKMACDLEVPQVFVHSLIGRRGERPESGAVYVAKVAEMCRSLKRGRVVTVMGRFWALDREENWDRIAKAYQALVGGEGNRVVIET